MGFFSALFGDESDAFDRYARQMQALAHRYDPFIKLGLHNFNRLDQAASQLTDNPAGLQDALAAHYHSSPYQHRLLALVRDQLNDNAANTGMIGSTAANSQLANRLLTMAGQFQNNYIDRALGQYNRGLGYQNQLAQAGLGALGRQSGMNQEAGLGQLQGDITSDQALQNMIGVPLALLKAYLAGA